MDTSTIRTRNTNNSNRPRSQTFSQRQHNNNFQRRRDSSAMSIDEVFNHEIPSIPQQRYNEIQTDNTCLYDTEIENFRTMSLQNPET